MYVDATGALKLGRKAHTGIPRVQDFLVRSAIADHDPVVSVVVYDSGSADYRYLTNHEVTQLTFDPTTSTKGRDDRTLGILRSLRDAIQTINANPHLAREFDREVARGASDGRESGAKYVAIKYITRIYRCSP